MRKRFCFLLALILIVALVMSGCGNVDNTDSAPDDEVPTAPEIEVVRIAYIAMTMTSPQALVGVEEGIFEDILSEQGLSVEWVQTRSLDKIWPMMDAGEVDFAYLPANNFATYITETSDFGGSDDFRIIAGSLAHDINIIMAGPQVQALSDLDGKTVGIVNHNYLEEMMLDNLLQTVGLRTKAVGGTVNVEYQDMMNELYESFASGKYEAICSWTVQRSAVENKIPGAKFLMYLNEDNQFGPASPQNWLTAKKEWIELYPDIVKLVLKAHIKATESALNQKNNLPLLAEAAYNNYFENVLRAQTYPKYPTEYYLQDWEDATPTYDPNIAFLAKLYDFETKAGYLTNKTIDNIYNLKLLNEVLSEEGLPIISK